MESYIVQLNFSAAFDRARHSGLLFKLKYIGVGVSVLSICTEFLSDRRQRVVVDGATSEWITIILGVPQGSVLGHLLFILYTSEMFELVENRLYAYADDSTPLAVVRKPADTPAVAASLNRDLARIQVWPNKTKAFVVSRSRTVNPPYGDLTDEYSMHAILTLYPEWPHRQCVGLAYSWTRVRAQVAAAGLVICRPRLHSAKHETQGVLSMRVEGATSQLDLPSLTPLSVACCGGLQLGIPHWATSVLLQVVDN